MDFLERFSFSRLRSVPTVCNIIFIRDHLLYNEIQSVDIDHVFIMTFCYVLTTIGGLVGNSDYGKNKAILTFSILYWIGILILFWSTVQAKNSVFNFTTLCGVIFVLIGVGCMKCCMAAFNAKIVIENGHNVTSAKVHGSVGFYNTLYYPIHLGILFGMIISPVMKQIVSLKAHHFEKYSMRFGLVVIIAMSISIGVFVCGSPYYLFKKSFTSILSKMIKCILVSLWKRLTSRCSETKNKHWLELAKDSFSNGIIDDTKKTLHLLCLCIPLSVFWSLFDQQHTTWIFESLRTSDHLIVIPFKVYMLQVVNPLLVLFTITYMNRVTSKSMKTMWYFCVALGNLAVIFFNKCVIFGKKSNMFAFIALLTIIVTSNLSNTYEKWYFKKETKNENNRDNANLGMLLQNQLSTIVL